MFSLADFGRQDAAVGVDPNEVRRAPASRVELKTNKD